MTRLTCREVSEFLLEYVSETLSADVHVHFESHVVECGNCRTYVEQYRATIAAGKLACCDDAAPVDCPEELVRAVMAALQKEPRP